MNEQKIKEVASSLKAKIGTIPDSKISHVGNAGKIHLLFMCDEVKLHVNAGNIQKANRWIGYIQGVLVSKRFATLDECKAMNMPD